MKKLLLSLILVQGLIAAPIHDVVIGGDLEMVQYAIANGYNVNTADENGETPLHIAAMFGETEIAKILIKAGARVNAIDNNGWTPLNNAVFNGHKSIVNILIENDADVNVANRDSNTTLHYATILDRENIVNLLIDCPLCDHTIANNNGKTPEEIACSRGHQKIADMLHDALSVEKKLVKSERNDVLQRLAARVANRSGITQKELNTLPYAARCLITKIIKEDEAGSSGYKDK